MALFKIFKGLQGDLGNVPIHEGYAYFTEDGHNLYIDISGTERVQVNADTAKKIIKSDGTYVDIDNILTGTISLTNSGPTTGILPIAKGGTGKTSFNADAVLLGNGTAAVKTINPARGSFFCPDAMSTPGFGTLPIGVGGTGAENATDARTNLDVYSTNEIDEKINKSKTQTYQVNIDPSSWSYNDEDGTYVYFWSCPTLTCGEAGNTPPIITYINNKDGYINLSEQLTYAEPGEGIYFYTTVDPMGSLGMLDLIIMDIK